MYTKINNCLCCNSRDLKKILDLNKQPLANSYLKNKTDFEINYPLAINYCSECTHIQLTHAVDPDKLFKNYLYVSGTTKTLKDYFDWFVDFTKKYTDGKNVLDIACNDGTQLDSYKKNNYNTCGIDPAENLYDVSSKNHNIVCDYLSYESISKFDILFDIIIAQNVFAHNTYPKEFLNICKSSLSKGGHIFIQTSQADMVKNNQFDTIYHEHISFFSVKSFCTLAKNVGLNVIDIQRSSVHGTSFIFVLSNDGIDQSEKFISQEYELNLEIMEEYSRKCKKIASDTFDRITQIKSEGYKVVGYGAAAKGNTFLNFSKINLDYIIDDNSLKQNLYTPGSRIPIYSSDKLIEEKEKICIIPLAWNFFDEIRERVINLEVKNCIFLKYFPEQSILK